MQRQRSKSAKNERLLGLRPYTDADRTRSPFWAALPDPVISGYFA
jgi:hypothetical protein